MVKRKEAHLKKIKPLKKESREESCQSDLSCFLLKPIGHCFKYQLRNNNNNKKKKDTKQKI